jgi:uncharacterized repeat protein (TIGR03843 family)
VSGAAREHGSARAVATAFELLGRGDVTVKGRLRGSSNATLLVELTLDGATGFAVYKPGTGERSLWDFPPRLYRREVAAYLLAEALGWKLVPPTILREGPYGEGSFQWFVDADFSQHYFTLREDAAHREQLQRIALFDVVANNADRKAGHCLMDRDGHIWAIDNGLCFHEDPKLRTVIWDFGGDPIPEAAAGDVRRFVMSGIPRELAALLSRDERRVLLARARAVVASGRFPDETRGRSYPWPLV